MSFDLEDDNVTLWRNDSAFTLNFSEITDWLVEPLTDERCALGFVCNETHQANCTNIRMVSLAYGFGDVHAIVAVLGGRAETCACHDCNYE